MAQVVPDRSIMQPVHPVFDAIARPMYAPTQAQACAVSACWCRPGTVGQFPPFEGHWKPRGTYFIKPPGQPVVRGPQGRPVAPQPQLPMAPRGLPVPGGQVVGPPGFIAPSQNDVVAPGERKRSWWPWLAAGGAAVLAAAR